MATIPIYDETVLPCLTYPFERKQEKSTKFLGKRAVVNNIYITITTTAKSDDETLALIDFWQADCNFGLEPFLIDTPITPPNGESALLCLFVDDMSTAKEESGTWKSTIRLRVLGLIIYIIDDEGQFVLDDSGDFTLTDTGDYLSTGNAIDSYREILWQ